jgi:YfiH family protein
MNFSDIYTPAKLTLGENIRFGFTTAIMGDIRKEENLRKLIKTLGEKKNNFVQMNQEHGNRIVWVDNKDSGNTVDGTDALITHEKNLVLLVKTADCLPILLSDNNNNVIGVIHAGWRGLYSQIILMTINAMLDKGSKQNSINVVIGPCIKSCCYKIDNKLKSQFNEKFSDIYDTSDYIFLKDKVMYMDILKLAKMQLIHAGVKPSRINELDICTMDDTRFYSHRRQKGKGGRSAGFILRI